MFDDLSDRELLSQWIAAAKKFCCSKTPDFLDFAIITWETDFEQNLRLLTSSFVPGHLHNIARGPVDEAHETGRCLVQAMRRGKGRGTEFERALLNSKALRERLRVQLLSLTAQSVWRDNILTKPEGRQLERRIWRAINRRKRQLQRRRGLRPTL